MKLFTILDPSGIRKLAAATPALIGGLLISTLTNISYADTFK